MLELRAIYLDHRAHIAHQALRRGFHHARLARTGRSQKEEIADGPPGARHARQERLINIHDLINRLVLPDDPPPEIGIKPHRFIARKRRV